MQTTVMLPIAVATATVRSATTRTCCRHSRRNMRQAQRTTGAAGGDAAACGGPRSAESCASVVIADQRLRAATWVGRRDGLVDDLAVAQKHDAVGPRGEVRLVRHDDTRDASLRCGYGAGA